MNNLSNIEAEQGVLGSCLIGNMGGGGKDSSPIDKAIDAGCNSSWFNLAKHKMVWQAMVDMHVEGKTVDLVTVGSKTKDYEVLNDLVDNTPSSTRVEAYLGIARKASRLRELRDIAEVMQDGVARDGASVKDIIAEASHGLTELMHNKNQRSLREMMEDNITVMDNAVNGIVSGVPLPWKNFSDRISGIQKGSGCLLIGRDGKGKSGCIAQMLDFWAGEGIPTLAFSMEDVGRRTLLRMAGCREWLSAMSIEKGKSKVGERWTQLASYQQQEVRGKLNRYIDWIENKPFWMLEDKMTVEEVCAKIRHHHRVHGIQAVTIDGFKDITHSKGKSDTECEKHIAGALYETAKDCNIAMVIVTHINKIDEGVPITKANLTGSGAQNKGARQALIFQDAGLPQIIDEHTFVLSCTKNNYGAGGSVVLKRDEHVFSYSEPTYQGAVS